MLLLHWSAGVGHAQAAQSAGRPARVVKPGQWQVVRTIGLDTDYFEQPRAIAANDTRILVFDGGDNALKSFRIDGKLEWKVGRTGRGPGEFLDVVDLGLDSAGNALVYDVDLGRVTIVSRAGQVVRTVRLTARADRVARGSGPLTLLELSTTGDTLARLVDTLGAIVGPIRRQPAEMTGTLSLGREISAVARSASDYLLTFRWSSRMLLLDRTGRVVRTCTGVDSLSFPLVREIKMNVKIAGMTNLRANRIDPRARQAAISATTFGNTVAVKTVVGKQRLIDLYGPRCGQYIESRRFPYLTTALAGNREFLIGMLDEPVPHLVLLRWAPK